VGWEARGLFGGEKQVLRLRRRMTRGGGEGGQGAKAGPPPSAKDDKGVAKEDKGAKAGPPPSAKDDKGGGEGGQRCQKLGIRCGVVGAGRSVIEAKCGEMIMQLAQAWHAEG
jgi:hypothetical protein